MARGDDHARIRLDGLLHANLKAEAERNKRSMNAEIVARLEASFSSGSSSLEGEIAAIIAKHVDAEVQRRLRAIVSQIGGAV